MAGNSSNNLTCTKYNVNFAGHIIETTVTKMASAAENWVREIRSLHNGKRIILGLDCEWRCTDYWGFFNKVATLQLCVDNKCLILQMVFMDYLPQALKDFLNDPNVTCVGVQVDEDVQRLKNEYGLGCSAGTVDIRELATRCYSLDPETLMGKRQLGLKDLALMVVGLHMDKPRNVCKSDWQANVLMDAQITYACIDAYVSYRIGRKLLFGN